ncbi:MAG: LPS assembly lipoprotein LptE [Halioglobus sp.]
MPQRLIQVSLLLASTLLLSACGFALRGTGNVAVSDEWRSMYLVTNNPNSEFSREVKTRFAANGVEWQEDKASANYAVILGPERFTQRNLSLNSEARAAEFELTMLSTFSVRDNSGEMVLDNTTSSVVKQMENDPRNVVGKAEEIRILKGEMRGELAQQILRRIAFFAAAQEP